MNHGCKVVIFYSVPWLEGEQVTKPGKSSVVFGFTWCASGVLDSPVFWQASMEICATSRAHLFVINELVSRQAT